MMKATWKPDSPSSPPSKVRVSFEFCEPSHEMRERLFEMMLRAQGRKEACERNKSEESSYERRAAVILRYLQDTKEAQGHIYEQLVPTVNILIDREIAALWIAHQNAGEMP